MGRLVIVSNRVGSSLKANQGGLATAMLAALDRREVIWFGWSGNLTDEEVGELHLARDGRMHRLLLDLNRADYEGYYLGFANRTLWPLFHYRVGIAEFTRADWAAYRRVNETFAERLAAILAPDDVVWIHDYHLIPLGAELRRRGVRNRLGFFLHIPFPACEVMTTLPVHKTMVRALFDYDLVGFQTANDVRGFVDYVEHEAGGWATRTGLAYAYGRCVQVGDFPISIDTQVVASQAARAFSTTRAVRLRQSLGDRALIIGVDRLDYTKGLIRRFTALEHLLEAHPEHRRGVIVLQIASPSREDIPEYQQIRGVLDGAIGRINGRFGEPDVPPVRYVNRHFRQETLFGFFRASRVGLVTPLRDGMNLVAKEFVACQDPDSPGVLVLSRFAGAARELDAALVVNPFDPDEIAEALDRALTMPLDERRERHQTMMRCLREHDVHAWLDSFLAALTELEVEPEVAAPAMPATQPLRLGVAAAK